MSITTRLEWSGDVAVVHCSGRLVAGADCERLQSELLEAARDASGVVLQISELSVIDSSGLGALLRASSTLGTKDLRLVIAGASPISLKLLKLTKLDSVLTLCAQLDDAVRMASTARSADRDAGHGPSILLVEPSAEVTACIGAALRAEGYRVTSTRSAHDARILARHSPPELVLIGPNVSAQNSPSLDSEIAPGCAVVSIPPAFLDDSPEVGLSGVLAQVKKAGARGK